MSQVPPWKFSLPIYIVNFELSVHKKSITNPVEFRTYFAELLESFIDYTQIYTDESKDANKTALAVVYPSFVYSKRLPDKSSIFTAELEALIFALRYVKVTNTDQKLCFVGFPQGNECADKAAKEALSKDVTECLVSYTDARQYISEYVKKL